MSSPAEAAPVDIRQYRREVLDIETVISVTLARKKSPLEEVLNIVPGSILTFDVHCDEPLTMEAAQTVIAVGETVKIGDKFGLRVRHIVDEYGNPRE